MSSMAEMVVKYLPQMNSASSFPAAIIRRKADAVIDPSGKASFAATANLNGVVDVTGVVMFAPVIAVVHGFFRPADFRIGHQR
jgi:hypothetical protein